MKKLLTVVFTMLVAGSLCFAQDTGGATGAKQAPTGKTQTAGKKGAKTGAQGRQEGQEGILGAHCPSDQIKQGVIFQLQAVFPKAAFVSGTSTR